MREETLELIDKYAEEYRTQMLSYQMMGKLLETEKIKKRILLYHINNVFIYGGGYLGVQLYNSIKEFVKIEAIVDKNEQLSVKIIEEINVISIEKLKKIYKNQTVIITPIKYGKQIKQELLSFVDENQILYLGEFIEGIV